MKKSYNEALRQIVLSKESACLSVYRLGGGTEFGIAAVLCDTVKMTMALRAALLTVAEIERLITPLSEPGITTNPATYDQIQAVLMVHQVNAGAFK